MSIEKEKVVKNYEQYVKVGKKYGFLTDELKESLGTDLIGAPASTMSSLHNAFQGGLIAHLLLVTKYALAINDNLPESLQESKESVVKVSCLHQIGKTHLYSECTSDWHKKNQGKMYEFNEDMTSLRVGSRSAYYAMSNGVELTEDEYQAISTYDVDETDKQVKWHSSMLATILKQANELAIKEEQNEQ